MKIRFMLSVLLLSGFGASQLTAMEAQQGQNQQFSQPVQKILTPHNAAIVGLAGLAYKDFELAQKVALGGMTVYSTKKAYDEYSEAKKSGFNNKLNFAGYVGMTLTSAWLLYQSLIN